MAFHYALEDGGAHLGLKTGFDPEFAAMSRHKFAALLDGLSIQVALDDPEIDSDVAYDIAMRFAERELDLPSKTGRAKGGRAHKTPVRSRR